MIDTTNQFGPDGVEELPDGKTAAQVNAERMPGARYVKAFNTLTAGFQGSAAGRSGDERVAMFLCGDDDEAKETVKKLIREIGFAPVDVGGTGRRRRDGGAAARGRGLRRGVSERGRGVSWRGEDKQQQ